ncbi:MULTISPECIES: DNA-binding transcriptional regulator CsiR [unclassified Cobetia]|uniref:DNA-binding transcriptional regulator CsiR n=1 Tax=unclassified Cobetia TaxID=2609414 RepID=UPI00178D055A|nr:MULTISPECIES: DNA-binding transcriptional regulator CsiR [unclassified Cobetia]MBE2167760.1 DNA-binding transcriptional regulator CsiR [Cobetia sp. 2AS1]MDH2446182.1 DNA-binding transcriptional regulator CsiR [Cobetia sp. 2AS]
MPKSSRPNLAVSAYQQIKQDIIRGVHTPGKKLLMSHLKERYGLGVGPLREALSQLVGERLVIAISQRGYRVAPMSVRELQDIYDARANLEKLIVELAIERGGDDWEADIIAKGHTLNKVSEIHSPEQMLDVWDARHKSFHTAIAAGCRSPHLLHVRESLSIQAERYRHLWLCQTVFSPQALTNKRKEHSEIIEVILTRNASAAGELIRKHLMTPVPLIGDILEKLDQ